MYKVGLTGSIGSGKSTVSNYIRNQGIPVIDADEISRSLTVPESPIIDELVESFGAEILVSDEDKTLDRKKLAELAFSSEKNRTLLSEIVTLRVKDIIEAEGIRLDEAGEELVFFDIPLLFEYDMYEDYDEIWTVVAPLELRYLRVLNRESISEEDFFARDAAQVPQEEKILRSDLVINNDKDVDYLLNLVSYELDRLKRQLGLWL